jgi:hypothetical protein
MQATTNKPETKEEVPVKSVEDAQREYEQLLEEYERFRNDVETQIRRMRGGRVFSWDELLARVLRRKPQETSESK